ncbi:trifunctional histidinol dehydrogenase [Kappamyces sp. JEL0829]|nr:trifunctional histidinol dehydrogenase [Kappamyces sp. JEL0829]
MLVDFSFLLPSKCPELAGIALASPVIVSGAAASVAGKNVWAKVESVGDIVAVLDSGFDVALIPFGLLQDLSMSKIEELLEGIPPHRLALLFRPDPSKPSEGPNIKALSSIIQDFIIVDAPAVETIVQLSTNFSSNNFHMAFSAFYKDTKSLMERGISVVLDGRHLSFAASPTSLDFTELYLLHSKSDRDDGLFTTIVVDEHGVALGLCYSSAESLKESLRTQTGVYHSRTRGLWYKGKTSGATQKLLQVDLDCDSDTLRFTVIQKDPGFCHLETRTCFGADKGLTALYSTLVSRLASAPPKSYTKRLFSDPELLHSKIREEADELCEAKDRAEVAWEAADLIYFAFAKAVANGVSLSDIEANLDAKAKKITRRPGNAKPPKDAAPSVTASVDKVALSAEQRFHMKTYDFSTISQDVKAKLLLRPILKTNEIMDRVRPIVGQVRQGGDKAIKEFTSKFDGVELDSVVLKAPFPASLMQIPDNVKQSIDLAYANVEKFHAAQMESEPLVVETMPGVTCSRFARPIERVGLYVPGGTAVLPSSTLMLGVPAKVAGCQEIVIATPPRKDGSIVPEVVYVAHKVGATCIVKAGGAQAVAAMAYGTETVPKVDKICGPGNQYVTAAKMIAQSDSSALLSIDMPAGPSELLVIADATADPRYVISDLLSQAEHGEDSQVVLLAVGLSGTQLDAYQTELDKQASVLPRAEIVRVSISKSYILSLDTLDQALEFSNKYAPEHLILNIADAESVLPKIMNAGSVFVGPYSPERYSADLICSCGDYASGTNHTLPTYGYAKMYSGVNTHTFLKHITSQTLTRDGLDAIGDAVVTLASIEGLEAHRNAVAIRLGDIRQ